MSFAEANVAADQSDGEELEGVYRKKTIPVGSFAPNAWGLYDMHGNVAEYCEDPWHDDGYSDAPTDGKVRTHGGDLSVRLVRGGAWNCFARRARCPSRTFRNPQKGVGDIGFRIVAGIP